MGYQESMVKIDSKEVDAILKFCVNNKVWFAKRDFAFYGACKVLKPFTLQGYRYKKGEIVLWVGGDRHPQRGFADFGLYELPQVLDIVFIEEFDDLRKKNQTLGNAIDEYIEMIRDLAFYKPYLNPTE